MTLQEGANPFTVIASNPFGLQGQASRTLFRYTTPFASTLDWPLPGLAIPASSTEVRGHVLRAGTTVQVNGVAAPVDPGSLTFSASVPLQPGPNTLTALGSDQAGNSGTASVQVTSAPAAPAAASYRWDLPADGSSSALRSVPVSGMANLPGVAAVTLNGQAMTLTGQGGDGSFSGSLALASPGPNALVLEVTTLAGQSFSERREVRFTPALPQVTLAVPDSARPGDSVPITVAPVAGTGLMQADITWNGLFLASVSAPWAPVSARIPANAAIGAVIPVSVLARDDQGSTVTARAGVTVYGAGALLVQAFDDSQGLPCSDLAASATLEGGPGQALDGNGRAALATALPQNWIRLQKPGFTQVWRSAALTVGATQTAVSARLTPLASAQAAGSAAFSGSFGGGALQLSLPAGALRPLYPCPPLRSAATACRDCCLPAGQR